MTTNARVRNNFYMAGEVWQLFIYHFNQNSLYVTDLTLQIEHILIHKINIGEKCRLPDK